MLNRSGYLDPALTFEERVRDLISRMTLEEKVSQMRNDCQAIPRLGILAYNFWSEGLHGVAGYTHLEYESLELSTKRVIAGKPLSFRVKIRNFGPTDAEEVVLLYLSDLQARARAVP